MSTNRSFSIYGMKWKIFFFFYWGGGKGELKGKEINVFIYLGYTCTASLIRWNSARWIVDLPCSLPPNPSSGFI